MAGKEAGRKIFSTKTRVLKGAWVRPRPGESEVGHYGLPRWRNDLGEVPAFCPLD